MLRPALLATVPVLMLVACSPGRQPVDVNPDGAQSTDGDMSVAPPDAAAFPQVDLGYLCGRYSAYTAQVNGIVRSPCDYDVSKILQIGGEVKTKINPPTISMQFPDGTFFSGTSDGQTFTATRLTDFPYTDGCMWRATETLSGTIDVEHNCTLNANYTYREAPTSPPPCATPCTIDAQVIINWESVIIG